MHDLCRSLDGLPLAIELAAARTRTLSVEEIARRLDDRFTVLSDPTSRKPERRRALRATIGWSYELLFPDDQRGLWALATFAGGAPLRGGRVRARGARRARGGGDRRGRAAREPLAGDRRRTPPRYRLLDSIRAFALEAMAEAGLTDRAARRARRLVRRRGRRRRRPGVRSAGQAEHLAFARAERANIDAALAWSAGHDPQRALAIANGFGWAWIVLGDSRGAQRILAALDAAGDAAPARDRAAALLLAGWIEASTGHLEPARRHVAAAPALADAIDDATCRRAARYHLAYVVSHHGEWEHALELTARSRALYDGLDRPWDQAANALFAARAAISAGDRARAAAARDEVEHWLRVVDDPWLHVRRDAMLGELARVEHRFDDAVAHIARAAETSGRLGFLQTEAYQLTSLGRAQCQAGDYDAGAATLELGDRQGRGHRRRPPGRARARPPRPRPARARTDRGGARGARGGAPRGTATPAAASRRRSATACSRRSTRRRRARRGAAARRDPRRRARDDDAPVEVFALDALARSRRGGRRRGARPARRPTGAWRPPRTSSPSATGPTLVAALVEHDERRAARP